MERCMLHASDDALFQCESELTQTDQSISAEADNRSNPSEMEIRAPKTPATVCKILALYNHPNGQH